jgi:hypothetical protein
MAPDAAVLFCAIADQASPEQALGEFGILLDYLQPDRLSRDPSPALLLADCLEVGHARGWNLRPAGASPATVRD